MKIYAREFYLQKLRPFYKTDLIKVICGIRRCGKSCLMLSIIEELKNAGVDEKDIIYLNLDKRGYRSVKTPDQLERVIDESIHGAGYKYLFIDEVQNVVGFEAVVNAFREEGNCSIFITGSNSYLLSGELSTKLTGRYIEVELWTLSFYEYLDMKRFLGKEIKTNLSEEFTNYIRVGGFPKVVEFDDVEVGLEYVRNVIEQIMVKDVRRRNKIRNRSAFEKVRTYFINNFGSPVSLDNLVNYLAAEEHLKIKRETLSRYLRILEDAKILYRCSRFDLKSKKSLMGEGKYYLADTSIYFASNTDGRINYGPVLENLLYVYLRSRDYKVSVGRIGEVECDFIARKNGAYAYVQVAMTILNDKSTEEREYRPFGKIRDNYPKYLFTLDPLVQERDGVHHMKLLDFMAMGGELGRNAFYQVGVGK